MSLGRPKPCAILVGPGELSEKGVPERPRDRWIAVDGGLEHCANLGRMPDLAIGDWDSLEDPGLLSEVQHLTLDPEKERSDYFHALLAAVQMGVEEVEAHGMTAGRPDHHWAVIADSIQAVESGHLKQIRLIGPEARYYLFSHRLREGLTLALPRGAVLSVFAVGNDSGGLAQGVTFKGLKYSLRSAKLTPSSRGLSNLVVQSPVSIRCRRGVLLVIAPSP